MNDHRSSGGDLHRLLDEAFAGIEVTPEIQDLKEEIRGNLLARMAELEASGLPQADAARRAVAELGDVHELIEADGTTDAAGTGASSPSTARSARAARVESAGAAALRNRVRPKPAFVVRTVVLAIIAAAALVLLVLGLTPLLPLAVGALIALAAVFGLALGTVTGDALSQETTTNHRMPAGRALGYGAATGLLLAGLAFTPIVILHLDLGWLVLAGAAVVAAIGELSYLGATQTNRHKPWVVQQHRDAASIGTRFEDDPAAGARFGIYSAVIWILAFVAIPIIGFTAGWIWAPLAFIGGFVAMMLVLARMLFGEKAGTAEKAEKAD
ncbi:permease prefix domain 1-containing protein [Agromyces sp. Marseille-Q5079]|uniref:permease prefix domain 1-containing protein n=1 Tax=Agromyces sp. Marseille-Q5079 TaxID=3439059 RepID=UPI003D9CB375